MDINCIIGEHQICVHQSNYNCVSKLQVIFVTLDKLKIVVTLAFRGCLFQLLQPILVKIIEQAPQTARFSTDSSRSDFSCSKGMHCGAKSGLPSLWEKSHRFCSPPQPTSPLPGHASRSPPRLRHLRPPLGLPRGSPISGRHSNSPATPPSPAAARSPAAPPSPAAAQPPALPLLRPRVAPSPAAARSPAALPSPAAALACGPISDRGTPPLRLHLLRAWLPSSSRLLEKSRTPNTLLLLPAIPEAADSHAIKLLRKSFGNINGLPELIWSNFK
uniref:Uncharacterized protein n=1 Tax=Setaria viridis TaxID=4556 RepID=A0A4U6TWU0_SETVI|nr:hypothetical protein SEVIR_7G217500v2 [Setaria viridis]